jgi:hypothetical protein
MSEVDPDPFQPRQGESELGGQPVSDAGDPTHGGKDGEIGTAPSVAADEPDLDAYPVGGGNVGEESDAVPGADPGPDA